MKKNSKKVFGWMKKVLFGIMCAFCFFQFMGFYAQANINNIGQNAGNFLLEQISWIIVVFMFIVGAALYAKRAYTALITTLVVGSVILVFINNPTLIEQIGNKLVNILLQ